MQFFGNICISLCLKMSTYYRLSRCIRKTPGFSHGDIRMRFSLDIYRNLCYTFANDRKPRSLAKNLDTAGHAEIYAFGEDVRLVCLKAVFSELGSPRL